MSNHTACDNLKHVQHLPILKTNKKFDTYTMISRQLHEFLPTDEHIQGPPRMFRKEASIKQITVSSLLLLFIVVCCCSLLYSSIQLSHSNFIVIYCFLYLYSLGKK